VHATNYLRWLPVRWLSAVVGLVANAIAKGVGVRREVVEWLGRQTGVTCSPEAEEKQDQDDAEQEKGEGTDPGYVVKAAAHGFGKDGGTVFCAEEFEDGVVGCAGIKLGVEIGNLTWGIGAAYVVAFEQDLAASAGAHEVVTETVVAG
jgi:hypothetical protein